LIGVSALGAAGQSDRGRALHLAAWLVMMVAMMGLIVPVIGEAGQP
jgi:predicted metal-binding membrane protein